MATPFSVENLIRQRIDALGITSDFLSALAGIPPSRISQALRELRPLDSLQGTSLLKILDRLDSLVKLAAPVPISWKSPPTIRLLLQKLEDEELQIQITDLTQPEPLRQ